MKDHLKRHFIILLFLLLSLTKTQSENEPATQEENPKREDEIENLLKTKCDGDKITYTIKANLLEYLENDENSDGREMYEKISDLKTKRIGLCRGTYFDNSIEFDSITEYENKDLLIDAIRSFKIDAGIIFEGIADTVQEYSNTVSKFPENLLDIDIVFGLQKENTENTELKTQLNEFIANNKQDYEGMATYWDLVHRENGFLNKTLTPEKNVLKVIAKIDMSPNCYLRSYDGELIGAEIEFIYNFAREYGYGLSFEYADVDDELIDALKNKKADIALGFFVKRAEDAIDMTDTIYSSHISLLVRFGNLPESIKWTLYDGIEQFNGDKIGIFKGSYYDILTEKYFNESEFVEGESLFELMKQLLLEEIDGFIFDKPAVEYYVNLFPYRLSIYLFDELELNQNAFGFQKNEEGEKLAKQFNEFLKTIDVPALEKKWNRPDWTLINGGELYDNSDLKIDKDLNPDDPLLTVGFELGLKPLSFNYGNEPMGIEVEIIYLFAKAKHYNIKIVSINLQERLTYLKEGKVNITGGDFSISEERKKDIIFSDVIYTCETVLAVRLDCKKYSLPIEIYGNNGLKEKNNVDINVKFQDGTIKNSSCVFPSLYNDILLINCTIDDIQDVNVSNGFEYVGTEDKILMLYNFIVANNFFQANKLIEGHTNIIQESDKSEEIVCTKSSNKFSLAEIITSVVASSGAIAVMFYLLKLCF